MKQILTAMAIIAIACTGCITLPTPQSQLRLPTHFMEHQFDGREWKVGYQNGNQRDLISEFVLPGESVQNWTELLTAHVHFSDKDLTTLLTVMRDQLSAGSKDFKFSILEDKPTSVAFEWSHKGSGQWPAQRECKRIMRGTDGLYTLSYAVKESSFSQVHYDKWKENIMKMQLGLMQRQ